MLFLALHWYYSSWVKFSYQCIEYLKQFNCCLDYLLVKKNFLIHGQILHCIILLSSLHLIINFLIEKQIESWKKYNLHLTLQFVAGLKIHNTFVGIFFCWVYAFCNFLAVVKRIDFDLSENYCFIYYLLLAIFFFMFQEKFVLYFLHHWVQYQILAQIGSYLGAKSCCKLVAIIVFAVIINRSSFSELFCLIDKDWCFENNFCCKYLKDLKTILNA